jgi:DNA-binding Lrp family transcriptional regulator
VPELTSAITSKELDGTLRPHIASFMTPSGGCVFKLARQRSEAARTVYSMESAPLDGSEAAKMPRAFVMINVKVGTDRDVVSELKTFKYVDKVYEVYGVYDIVAEVKASSMEELKETVNSDMRKLKNVLATNTIIVTGS